MNILKTKLYSSSNYLHITIIHILKFYNHSIYICSLIFEINIILFEIANFYNHTTLNTADLV